MASVADGTWMWIVLAEYDDVHDMHIVSSALEARRFCESYSCINCIEHGNRYTKTHTAIYGCDACGDASLTISRKRVDDPHPPDVFDCASKAKLRAEVCAELELLPPSTACAVSLTAVDEEEEVAAASANASAAASAAGKRERGPTEDTVVDAAKRDEASQESKRARSDEDA